MDEFTAQWVQPYYLKLLGYNYRSLQGVKLDNFVSSTNQALLTIDETVVARLLSSLGWRERLTGSWFAGLKRWNGFANQIGELLVESNRPYAGHGYCFALGRFADTSSSSYLASYLDKYLPRLDCYYDQHWAIAALIWIDNLHGSGYSKTYLEPNGLWEQFIANKPQSSLAQSKLRYESAMVFCNKWFDAI
ncbi:MAG TPA: DUF6000 family protein [Coleofasciculaceae cyanobacterium]|jgi:hypothetical protein